MLPCLVQIPPKQLLQAPEPCKRRHLHVAQLKYCYGGKESSQKRLPQTKSIILSIEMIHCLTNAGATSTFHDNTSRFDAGIIGAASSGPSLQTIDDALEAREILGEDAKYISEKAEQSGVEKILYGLISERLGPKDRVLFRFVAEGCIVHHLKR